MNVVLIISDTFRRDHLGCYGNEAIHTPHLDRFAKRSVVFDNAYATSFPTMPMRADLYTGRFTCTYLGWAAMPADEVILPQLMTDGGYLSMGIVDTPFYTSRAYHYDRGFSNFLRNPGQGTYRPYDRRDACYERRYEDDYFAPKTCLMAEHWLERYGQEQFFLYVDTWDPHEPWDPPAHYVRRYKPDWDGKSVGPVYWRWRQRGITEEQIATARACYAGEVTMVDRAVGRLIDRLDTMGLLETTAVIFTSDHGFLIGEHGIFGKALMKDGHFYGAPLYAEIARVPLIVYRPGREPGRRHAIVSHPDLMPTALEIAGLPIPDGVQGRSFLRVLNGETDHHRDFALTTMPLSNPGEVTRVVDNYDRKTEVFLPATISTREWSLLYAAAGQPVELYDLKADPRQADNVAEAHPEVVERLHGRYVALLEEVGTDERLLEPRRRLQPNLRKPALAR
ncbi:MAG: sulfatase [Kiritimatiellae bacterium]|nr:sulfatase [Kiritimatiellia bacterium]